jgi:hypothetical protein
MQIPLSQTYGKKNPPRNASIYGVNITRTVQSAASKVFIQWEVRGGTSADGYTFTISRSGSPGGPWQVLATDLEDVFLYVDSDFPANNDETTPNLMSLRRPIYYKVQVTHPDDGTAETTAPIEGGLDRRRHAMVKKLRRDATLKIRKGTGTEVAILKRKWWGVPCTCRSQSGIVTRAHCDLCKGTGVQTGYWDPVYTFGKRTVTSVQQQLAPSGTVETNRILVTIPHIPFVEPQDIIVFMRDAKRYIAENVMITEIHVVGVHQEIQVSELAKSSREYSIPVDNWHTEPWY